ncbi:MAG: type II toxin-antitoxin system VapC family toxin [Candidatus Aenigmarchaeota archaeon]|nr:type II toxin-antitoxin system VapC family toxin [Candidatus Aenigmarchaeota archaeon]
MIILDSSFLIAFKILDDVHHQKAVKLMEKIVSGRYGKSILTDYIFDETVTGILARSKKLKLAIEFGEEILQSLPLEKITDKLFSDSWEIFKKQSIADLSFTDAIIISVMRENEIKNIATFDGDFKKINGINVIS